MAIPDHKPVEEVRAKVRIGQKVQSRSGREVPSSVDYFICDDAEFLKVVGEKQNRLRVFLPFQSGEDCFPTGLEWWAGKLLVCYAKGETQDGKPVALRKATMKKGGQDVNLLADAELLSDEAVGQDRRKIVCPVRECAFLKSKECKPMGRLQFWIDGIDRRGGVFQIDTKSWNSIENVERTLRQYPDPRGVPFVLRVEMTQRGRDRFPELYLEAEVEIKNDADAALADALVQLRKMIDLDVPPRNALAAVLDITNPGWRERQDFIDRIKAVGVKQAASSLLARYEL